MAKKALLIRKLQIAPEFLDMNFLALCPSHTVILGLKRENPLFFYLLCCFKFLSKCTMLKSSPDRKKAMVSKNVQI